MFFFQLRSEPTPTAASSAVRDLPCFLSVLNFWFVLCWHVFSGYEFPFLLAYPFCLMLAVFLSFSFGLFSTRYYIIVICMCLFIYFLLSFSLFHVYVFQCIYFGCGLLLCVYCACRIQYLVHWHAIPLSNTLTALTIYYLFVVV